MKRLLLGTLILSCAALLSGCEKPVKQDERRITVEVTHVKLTSKSNSKVDLRDVKTGRGYFEQRLSCSRSRAANVQIGSKWDVTEVDYYLPESKRYYSELVDTKAICTLSN
ncbi:hypothetical protein PJKIFABJ_00130 [Pseudomonas phage PE09]|uniref:Lipoprotein n=1 Tax=Pseudomonas phage PE09 TaxID=2696355 RepID=A0A9E6GNE5_9CAUD|nr:hypothetical protein QGX22_gp124 [Pseudomonas phage PE09]QHZ60066.1 hypothetical protein PJKIFABJ_00130 [Pseudomonas phage PE09]